tara:strand:- start:132 stop:431 length:300 start_codon:yes stop_codon:yes gene_type:complete
VILLHQQCPSTQAKTLRHLALGEAVPVLIYKDIYLAHGPKREDANQFFSCQYIEPVKNLKTANKIYKYDFIELDCEAYDILAKSESQDKYCKFMPNPEQ